MNKIEILNLIIVRDYAAIENALKNGFDANTILQNDTSGIDWASNTDDFQMMELFWKNGATSSNEYVNEIIEAFEQGKTYLDFVEKEAAISDYHDLTNDFSVTKLVFKKGTIQHNQDNKYSIFIPSEKFVLDGSILTTEVNLETIFLPKEIYSCIGKTFEFPINPNEGYIDGSIYLREAHNPIDVSKITFLKLDDKDVTIEITMFFDFEYEGIELNNETITKTFTVEIV